jgi:hypothetical protein
MEAVLADVIESNISPTGGPLCLGKIAPQIIEVYLPKPQAPSNGLPVRIRLQS